MKELKRMVLNVLILVALFSFVLVTFDISATLMWRFMAK